MTTTTLFASAAHADGSSATSATLDLLAGAGDAGLPRFTLTVAATSRFTSNWLAELGARGLSWPGAAVFNAGGGGVPYNGGLIPATAGPDPVGCIILEVSVDGGTTWAPYTGDKSKSPGTGVIFTSDDLKYPETRVVVVPDAPQHVRAKYSFVSGPPATNCTFSLVANVT